jgi:hypothetical protein
MPYLDCRDALLRNWYCFPKVPPSKDRDLLLQGQRLQYSLDLGSHGGNRERINAGYNQDAQVSRVVLNPSDGMMAVLNKEIRRNIKALQLPIRVRLSFLYVPRLRSLFPIPFGYPDRFSGKTPVCQTLRHRATMMWRTMISRYWSVYRAIVAP